MEEDPTPVRGTGAPTTGSCQSLNAKLRDELLDGEIFRSLAEAKVVIAGWRRPAHTRRPHSSLGYRRPEAVQWPDPPPGPVPPAPPAVTPRPVMHQG